MDCRHLQVLSHQCPHHFSQNQIFCGGHTSWTCCRAVALLEAWRARKPKVGASSSPFDEYLPLEDCLQ